MKNPFGWNLPPGCHEHDPNAPWNDLGHCKSCCPAHEDAKLALACLQCGQPKGRGVCWLYELLGYTIGDILSRLEVLHGLADRYCTFPDEPACSCNDCACNRPDGRERH